MTVATLPCGSEGKLRMHHAEAGIIELRKFVDSLLTIANQKLVGAVGKNGSILEAFSKADEMVLQTVCGITDLITRTQHMGIDFADVLLVLRDPCGVGAMGYGSASGEDRAIKAAESAIAALWLEDVDIHRVRGILVNVTGNEDMTLAEYDEAVSIISNKADRDTNMICGMVYDQSAGDEMCVTVVVTGLISEGGERSTSVTLDGREALATEPGNNQAFDEESHQIPAWIHRKIEPGQASQAQHGSR